MVSSRQIPSVLSILASRVSLRRAGGPDVHGAGEAGGRAHPEAQAVRLAFDCPRHGLVPPSPGATAHGLFDALRPEALALNPGAPLAGVGDRFVNGEVKLAAHDAGLPAARPILELAILDEVVVGSSGCVGHHQPHGLPDAAGAGVVLDAHRDEVGSVEASRRGQRPPRRPPARSWCCPATGRGGPAGACR